MCSYRQQRATVGNKGCRGLLISGSEVRALHGSFRFSPCGSQSAAAFDLWQSCDNSLLEIAHASTACPLRSSVSMNITPRQIAVLHLVVCSPLLYSCDADRTRPTVEMGGPSYFAKSVTDG